MKKLNYMMLCEIISFSIFLLMSVSLIYFKLPVEWIFIVDSFVFVFSVFFYFISKKVKMKNYYLFFEFCIFFLAVNFFLCIACAKSFFSLFLSEIPTLDNSPELKCSFRFVFGLILFVFFTVKFIKTINKRQDILTKQFWNHTCGNYEEFISKIDEDIKTGIISKEEGQKKKVEYKIKENMFSKFSHFLRELPFVFITQMILVSAVFLGSTVLYMSRSTNFSDFDKDIIFYFSLMNIVTVDLIFSVVWKFYNSINFHIIKVNYVGLKIMRLLEEKKNEMLQNKKHLDELC